MSPRPLGYATVSILKAIRDGRCYGIEIMDETGLGGGTVYKVLGRLEERGMVRGQWEAPEVAERERRPRRRYYELTAAGDSELGTSLERFRALSARTRRTAGPLPGEG
jgi:DNA-binding PadR family transcriptional regulator